ncbi:MAG: RsmD family RNA methyltransferase [Dehalococcoidia bacterium]|nr:RsmD family RNA methyltransferase [Dehalococcoidia bacterium]
MEILITVTDPKGEITIRRDKEGGRFIQIYLDPPIDKEIINQAIELIEKEVNE